MELATLCGAETLTKLKTSWKLRNNQEFAHVNLDNMLTFNETVRVTVTEKVTLTYTETVTETNTVTDTDSNSDKH